MRDPFVQYGWMVCNVHGEPAGKLWATEAEARDDQRRFPVGCDYHVRPVEVRTIVRGFPPEPWCHLVARADGAAGRDHPRPETTR